MPALSTSPSSLIATKACLNCLSEKELKGIIVYALRQSTGLTQAQVRASAACYKCMSKKQKLVAMTAMIINQLVPTLSVNQLQNASACKACASENLIDSDMLFLFATYFQSTAI